MHCVLPRIYCPEVTRDGRGYPLAANCHDARAASAIRRVDASYQNVLRICKPNIRGVTLHGQRTQDCKFFLRCCVRFRTKPCGSRREQRRETIIVLTPLCNRRAILLIGPRQGSAAFRPTATAYASILS